MAVKPKKNTEFIETYCKTAENTEVTQNDCKTTEYRIDPK